MSAPERPRPGSTGASEDHSTHDGPPGHEQGTAPAGGPTAGLPAGMLEALYARPSRKRTALVVLPVLVGLAVAAFVGAGLLWPGDPDRADDPVAPADTDARGASDGTTLTCWDGKPAASTDDCALPTGREGLRHVFPSFAPDELDCRDELVANPQYRRPTMWTCRQELAGPVDVTYSQLSGTRSARRYFTQLHAAPAVEPQDGDERRRERWATAPVAGARDPRLFSASIMLRGAPYAVTVTAERRPDVQRALDTLVQVRPVDRLRLADPEA